MSLKNCIQRALLTRTITPAQAERIEKLAAKRVTESQGEINEKAFIEWFFREAQEKKWLAELQVIANKRNLDNIKSHPDGIGRGVLALLTRDLQGRAGYSNVDLRALSIEHELQGRWAEAIEAYRPRNLGFSQDRAGTKRMVKELFGESSGDVDAARYGKMWSEVAEYGRERFNATGGYVPKRTDWGLPHIHDARAIVKAGREAWRDAIIPRLDRRRMYNPGGQSMTAWELDEFLDQLYLRFEAEANTAGHDIDRAVPRGVDHRLLTFKNSEAWLGYNETFGNPDIYGTMLNHFRKLAGDIALMEVLGPNPNAAMERFIEMAAQEPAGKGLFAGLKKEGRVKLIKATYEVVTGRANQSESWIISSFFGGLRNYLTGQFLGSALISSIDDVRVMGLVAKLNGMPAARGLREWVKQLNPAKPEDRLFAVKMGLGAEAWLSHGLGADRYGEITFQGVTGRLSDLTLRAGLLKPWTDGGKAAFGIALSNHIAENTAKEWGQLPKAFRDRMALYGIKKDHWEVIRAAPLVEHHGVKFMNPADVKELARKEVLAGAEAFRTAAEYVEAEEKLRGSRPAALRARLKEQHGAAQESQKRLQLVIDSGNRLHEYITSEMRLAFTEPDARIRAITTLGAKRGSVAGELWRSYMQFKSFSVATMAYWLFGEAARLPIRSRAPFFAKLLVGSALTGAVALQARNVIKGKDPEAMDDAGFWLRSVLQSGGLGLMGDFVRASENRYGKGIITTLLGPTYDFAEDILKLTAGNLADFVEGRNVKASEDLLRFSQKYTPGVGTNLFYTRLAMERLLWDELRRATDPNAEEHFRRVMERAKREHGLEYWWSPGEPVPERAPDVSATLGE